MAASKAASKISDEVPKKQFAAFVNLTVRQVTNLQEVGLPTIVRGSRVFISWPDGLHWYIRRLKGAPNESAEQRQLVETRMQEIDLELKEIELAKERGALVTLDYMEARLGSTLERLRAKVLNIPGKYAPALVGLRTTAESQVRLEGIVSDALITLSETGDADDDDQDAS